MTDAGIIAVCVAFVAVYAISAYGIFVYSWNRSKANDKRFFDLMDRITNPRAVEAAAFQRALDRTDVTSTHPDWDAEDDEKFGRPVTEEFLST